MYYFTFNICVSQTYHVHHTFFFFLQTSIESSSLLQQMSSKSCFESLHPLQKEYLTLNLWPLPENAIIYDKKTIISHEITFQTNIKHQTLINAINRYNHLFFENQISKPC